MAVGGNGNFLGFFRHGKFRLQNIAVARDDGAVLIELEGARTGVHQLAVDIDLEEAVAFNGHVQRVPRILEIALREELVHGGGAHAHTDLNTHGQRRVPFGNGAGDLHGLIHEVFKFGAALFEARGIHVGQVVGNDVDIELLGGHARGGRPE